jgi:hypothetical protein
VATEIGWTEDEYNRSMPKFYEFDVGEYFYIAPVKRYPSLFAKGY